MSNNFFNLKLRLKSKAQRFLAALGRLSCELHSFRDYGVVLLLYFHLWLMTCYVNLARDPLRSALHWRLLGLSEWASREIVAKGPAKLLALLSLLIPLVPYGRRHRCLIVSLMAFSSLRLHPEALQLHGCWPIRFALGVRRGEIGVATKNLFNFHAWVEIGKQIRFDLDGQHTYKTVFEAFGEVVVNS
jgi:hypothetical protein